MKTTSSPLAVHVPATAGRSVGRGESAAAGAESVTASGSVPLAIELRGSASSCVGGSAAGAALAVAPSRSPSLWPRGASVNTSTPASRATTASALSREERCSLSRTRSMRALMSQRLTDDHGAPKG